MLINRVGNEDDKFSSETAPLFKRAICEENAIQER